MGAAASHHGRTNTDRLTAPPAIITVAIHLARRRTTPPRRQSRMAGPIWGWFFNQRDMRGELRAAAQAATSTNGTVGITGRNAPMTPSTRLTTASTLSSHRTGLESRRAQGGDRRCVGGGVMAQIVPSRLCSLA